MTYVLVLSSLLIAQTEPPFYADKADLLYVLEKGEKVPVKTPADWAKRRAHVIANMELVMGPMPKMAKVPLDVKYDGEEKFDTFIRKKLTFAAGPANNRVSAYLLVPNQKLDKKTPGVLCLHPTSKALGKGVPSGLGPKSDRHYA